MCTFGNEELFRRRLEKAQSSIQKLLGFALSDRDHEILTRLSNACCYRTQSFDFSLKKHWGKRKAAAEKVLECAKRTTQLIVVFEQEEKWIREFFQYNSTVLAAVEVPDAMAVRLKLSFLKLLLGEIAAALSGVGGMDKPRYEPENYYYFYLMDWFLTRLVRTKPKGRRVGGKSHIHEVIAKYVEAWGSADPTLRNLDADGVASRVSRFTSDNPDVARVVKLDPLAHVKQATQMDPTIDAER